MDCYQCQVEGLCGNPLHLAELHVNALILTIVKVSALASFLPGFKFFCSVFNHLKKVINAKTKTVNLIMEGILQQLTLCHIFILHKLAFAMRVI